MPNAFAHYNRFQSARGSLGALPQFAQSIMMLFALPGIILLLLSILLGLVSIFVLLLLTVPVYQVLLAIVGRRQPAVESPVTQNPFASIFGQMPVDLTGGSTDSPGVKQVEAKVTDPD